jgi:hypothetical protein
MAQTLSPNEIRERALKFAHDWAGIASEKAEAQIFWNEFFNISSAVVKHAAPASAMVDGRFATITDWGEEQMETRMIGWLDDDGNPQLEYMAD